LKKIRKVKVKRLKKIRKVKVKRLKKIRKRWSRWTWPRPLDWCQRRKKGNVWKERRLRSYQGGWIQSRMEEIDVPDAIRAINYASDSEPEENGIVVNDGEEMDYSDEGDPDSQED